MSKHKKKHPRGHGAPGSHGADRAGSSHDTPQPLEAASHPASDAAAAVDARVPAPAPDIAMVGAAANVDSDIRGVLIQVAGARLLLPNATIAEVLSYAEPEPLSPAPEWLLGRTRWRGWQLPLVAFSRLAGLGVDQPGLGSKVAVLKALAGNAKTPFFAVVTQGFPRLVTVSRDSLATLGEDGDALPTGVQARVRLNEDDALIPDLEAIEGLVAEAVAQAA